MEMQKSLVDRVITQIEIDMRGYDLTALEELLKRVPAKVLESYLPELMMNEYFVEHENGSDLIEAPNLDTAYEIANQLGLVVYHINEA